MSILKIISLIILAPILGGIIAGIDRKITARMQGRVGPPIMQPFYDFLKLIDKEIIVAGPMQFVYVLGYLIFNIFSLVLFAMGQDLLIIIFVMALASACLVLGAVTVNSPYSRIGGQRELIQIMAYEPVLIFFAAAVYEVTKSFSVKGVMSFQSPLLPVLPLVFLAFIYILTIKLRKSPFDFSSSAHAHQELVRGMLTEFSGPQLALIELTHWYEIVLLIGFLMLFYATNIYIAISIALFSFFLEIVIDNVSARLNWRWMFKSSWAIGISLCALNIVWLFLR